MGVKDLWNILSPLSERKPLFELQGKAIAIDLSCWIVDSQSVTENVAQPKMHLRNLFFRTSYFLLHDIFPVFVLEGTAPVLKHKTIAKRNGIRREGEEKKTCKKAGRTRFNYIIKECEEMLKLMGIVCVKGYGEAEAMCAYLNEDGLVDGCISQDSDCFLYGAKTVYRNFCTSTQGNRTTSGGSIDEYCMEKIQQVFQLGRNKMIALALLCGCDYDEGLNGVGKEAALKLFKTTDDSEILDRMKQWRTDSKFTKMENELSNPNICTSCGHSGKIRSHTKSGCIDCGTTVKCLDSYKEKRNLISNELSVRKKALLVENFPSQELVNEFLVRKGPIPSKLDLEWRKPKIVEFVYFMGKKVLWEPDYAFAKIFPLMTRWQLINLIKLPVEQRLTTPGVFIPEKIIKIRNIRSTASYEILWVDKDKLLEELTLVLPNSDDKHDDEEDPKPLVELVTIEPQDAVLKCYPDVVEIFDTLRNAKKKKPSRCKKKIKDNTKEVPEKKKTERKRQIKRKAVENLKNKKIEEFFNIENRKPTLEESFEKLEITPKRTKKDKDFTSPRIIKRGPQFDRVMNVERLDSILNGSLEVIFNQLTPEDFSSDLDNSMNMSLIVDNICNRKGDEKNIYIEYQENINSTKKENCIDNKCDIKDLKTGSFVENQGQVLNDLKSDKEIHEFESLNKTYVPLDIRENCTDYKYDTREVKTDIFIENQGQVSNDLENDKEFDEFENLDETYIPLDVRLLTERKKSNKIGFNSLISKSNDNRFSFGIDSLLNDTER